MIRLIALRLIFLVLAMLLSACSSLTTIARRPTDEIRNSTISEKSAGIQFLERRKPSANNPELEIAVLRRVVHEERYERRYVHRQTLSPVGRVLVWGGGTALAAYGYTLQEEGLVMLGRTMMGVGAAIPLGAELLVASQPGSERWEWETRTLPPRSEPAPNVPLMISIAGKTRRQPTDGFGVFELDISGYADNVPPGQLMDIRLTLAEAPSQKTAITIPANIVDAHRSCKGLEFVASVDTRNRDNMLCIILGIEGYQNISRVRYAECDASLFREYARKVLKIPEEGIYYRVSTGVTKTEFDKIFGERGWLERRIQRGQTDVLVYYAGHGIPDDQTKAAYFLPYEGDPSYPTAAVNRDWLYQRLNDLGANHVTVFADACFSGTDREGHMVNKDQRGPVIVPSGAYQRVSIFSATSGLSSAYSDQKLGHGVFTHYLMQGLLGNADLNRDRRLTLGELQSYIEKQIDRSPHEQQPEMSTMDANRELVRYR